MHGFAEVTENLFGGAAAGFVFVRIARFTAQQFLIFESQSAAADPLVAIAEMDMIAFCHVWAIMPGCASGSALDRILIPVILRRYL